MKELNIEFPFANFDQNIICQLVEERSQKLERINRAVAEGTYQINSKKLANILILKLIIESAPPDPPGPLPLAMLLLGTLAWTRFERGPDQPTP